MRPINRESPGRRRASPALPDRDVLAVQALGFVAADDDRLARFLAATGITADSLRRAAADPSFTDAVLAYLGSDEPLMLGFATAQRYDPEALGRAVAATR